MAQKELKRGLSARHIQMIALGGTIGVGLFMGSAKGHSMDRSIGSSSVRSVWYFYLFYYASDGRNVIS